VSTSARVDQENTWIGSRVINKTSAAEKPPQIVIVGESPGLVEVAQGKCFVGPTGKELTQRLLPQVANIKVPIWLTNLSKNHIAKPTAKVMSDWHLPLMHELSVDVKPKLVITLGRFATWAFLDSEPSMEEVHGMSWNVCTHYNHRSILVPCYHPAAGFHNPALMATVVRDFEFVGKVWDKIGSHASNTFTLDYGALSSEGKYTHSRVSQSKPVIFGRPDSRYALDTESMPDGGPLCISVTPVKGTSAWDDGVDGLVIHKVKRLRANTIIMHGSLHDLKALSKMGITLDAETKLEDTMIMAFMLGVEPLGLKALGKRLCRMKMNSYKDMIAPASDKIAHDFFKRLGGVLNKLMVDGVLHQGNYLHKRILRALKDKAKKPELDLRKRWKSIVNPNSLKIPEASLKDIPLTEMINYAGRDPHVTRKVWSVLKDRIANQGLQPAYDQDMAILPMLNEMQINGLLVDANRLEQLSSDVKLRIKSVEAEIIGHSAANGAGLINIGNKDEVSDLLFKRLKLPPGKLTGVKKRPSVAKGVLEGLKGRHPVVRALIRHSELSKIDNTYLSKLPGFIKNGRIDPNISLIRVPSGRLALKNPNLLAIPVRSEYGRKVRECFVAAEGFCLMSWDLDQIELRVLAHLSQDNALTSILRDENRHIHKETCSKIYGIPINRVSKDSQEYMMTKNITFGIVYLISAQGLHHQLVERGLNLSLDDCKQWIKEWYGIYDGVFKYQEHIKALARREGRVTSMLGRYRLTPGARSTKPSLVRDTLRQAVNHPVQTGAQEVLKAGMVKMWPYIRKYRKSIRALLQVHDELLFEVSDTEDGRYKSYADLQITYAMTNAMQLSVPIRVSKSEGSSWSELK
jgi:uracil-DNA glycosylase family 4